MACSLRVRSGRCSISPISSAVSCSTYAAPAHRDDDAEASDLLRLALGELARQRSTRRIALAPLSADTVGVLAAGSGLRRPRCSS